jgi:hypothetical protein
VGWQAQQGRAEDCTWSARRCMILCVCFAEILQYISVFEFRCTRD